MSLPDATTVTALSDIGEGGGSQHATQQPHQHNCLSILPTYCGPQQHWPAHDDVSILCHGKIQQKNLM